ncbi:DMT family transporter [Cohnella caldifontis]|uniref:DMT family transporter n=1 Tax=Cohnella caldifontis TaxID=3027471 RepID=UPI0023EE2266|nr:DMT family transporter [Cohnella sp. YIM B05605]
MARSVFPALLLLSLIWGGSYSFIKILLEDFGPWTVVFLRTFLGTAVVAIGMLAMREKFPIRNIPWLSVMGMALVNTCLPWALIGFSETRLSSSMASVLNATTPLWSLAAGVLIFGASAYRKQWIGMGAAMVGLLVLVGLNRESVISVDVVGFAGMMAASLFYGIGAQWSKRLLSVLSTTQATFCTLFFSMIGSGVMAFSTEHVPFERLVVPQNMVVMAGLGLIGSGIAYLLFYRIVQKGGPVYATMVTYLLPACSLVWGATLMHETIPIRTVAGLALILAGVYWANRTHRPRSLKPAVEG